MELKVYTDGSCKNNIGGYGCVLLTKTAFKCYNGIRDNVTNNKIELIAVIEALKLVSNTEYKKIKLYSDSAYIVNTMNYRVIDKWRARNWQSQITGEPIKHKSLWLELVGLIYYHKFEIEFIHVMGHSDNLYNQKADELARQAMIKALEVYGNVE